MNATWPDPRCAIRTAWGWLARHQCDEGMPDNDVPDDDVRGEQGAPVDAVRMQPTAKLDQILSSGVLKQVNSTTCGAASLIAARMLLQPDYAQYLLGAGANVDEGSVRSRFAAQSLAVHRRTTRLIARVGPRRRDHRLRLPWPRAIGTPPWGVRHELEALGGVPYRTVLIDPGSVASRAAAIDLLKQCMTVGLPAGLFTGNRLMPRHVTLVIGEGLRVYDPAKGVVVHLNRTNFVDGDLGPVAWTQPWAVLVPRGVGLRR